MCLICVELAKSKLTWQEARRNLGEMIEVIEPEHVQTVRNLIKKEELKDRRRVRKLSKKPAMKSGTVCLEVPEGQVFTTVRPDRCVEYITTESAGIVLPIQPYYIRHVARREEE